MNLCVLKHSHKAQILEHDESLAQDSCFFSSACTRCPDRGCGLCEDPAVLLAGRTSLQGNGMVVPSTGRPSCLWQVTVPAAVLGQPQGSVMLFLSSPSHLSQGCVSSGLSCCVQEQFALPGLPMPCLAMTSNTLSVPNLLWTQKVIPLYKG